MGLAHTRLSRIEDNFVFLKIMMKYLFSPIKLIFKMRIPSANVLTEKETNLQKPVFLPYN